MTDENEEHFILHSEMGEEYARAWGQKQKGEYEYKAKEQLIRKAELPRLTNCILSRIANLLSEDSVARLKLLYDLQQVHEKLWDDAFNRWLKPLKAQHGPMPKRSLRDALKREFLLPMWGGNRGFPNAGRHKPYRHYGFENRVIFNWKMPPTNLARYRFNRSALSSRSIVNWDKWVGKKEKP